MAQHDYVIDNSTGANVRADINNALLAISLDHLHPLQHTHFKVLQIQQIQCCSLETLQTTLL